MRGRLFVLVSLLFFSLLLPGCVNVDPDDVSAKVSSPTGSETVVFHTQDGTTFYSTVPGISDGTNQVALNVSISGFTLERKVNFTRRLVLSPSTFEANADGYFGLFKRASQDGNSLEFTPKTLSYGDAIYPGLQMVGGNLYAFYLRSEDNGFAYYSMKKDGSGNWGTPQVIANSSNDRLLLGESVKWVLGVKLPTPAFVNGEFVFVRLVEGFCTAGNNSIIITRTNDELEKTGEDVVYSFSRKDCPRETSSPEPCVQAISSTFQDGKLKIARSQIN